MPNNIGAATQDELHVQIESDAKKGIRTTIDGREQLRVTLNKTNKALGKGKDFNQDR